MRFSLLGHFQRMYPFSLHRYAVGGDRFSSWRSLFFYRCTDMISFAPLKSQGIISHASEISALPAPSGLQLAVDAPAGPVIPLPVTKQLRGGKLRKSKIGSCPTPSEPQDVKSSEPHFYEEPIATVLPPCSPKSIYILASLVRHPSAGCIERDANASNQARNPAPL